MDLFGQNNNGAEFSECRKYRYALWRIWDNSKPYYDPLIKPDIIIDRHFYWCNFKIGLFKEPEKRTDLNNMKKRDLCNWLGVPIDIPNIYIGANHCNIQILRNCVHPETGLHILNRALEIKTQSDITEPKLFENI